MNGTWIHFYKKRENKYFRFYYMSWNRFQLIYHEFELVWKYYCSPPFYYPVSSWSIFRNMFNYPFYVENHDIPTFSGPSVGKYKQYLLFYTTCWYKSFFYSSTNAFENQVDIINVSFCFLSDFLCFWIVFQHQKYICIGV